MNILVSGLDEKACRKAIGADPALESSVRWCPPDEFVEQLGRAVPGASEVRGIWLYQAPWTNSMTSAAGTHVGQTLAEWLRNNRNMLNARHRLQGSLVLVNIDRTSAGELRDLLLGDESDQRPANSPASSAPPRPALGKLFDWIAPQYWDVFEMLEAAAWIPRGGQPIFRELSSPTEEHLHELLRVLQDGHGAMHLRRELTEHAQRLGQNDRMLADANAELDQSNRVITELQKLATERETQLRALAEERDEHAKLAAKTSLELDRTTQAKAELQQLVAEHEAHIRHLVEERDRQAHMVAAHEELKQDNELLLIQLHQVQEELEQYYLKYTEQATLLDTEKKALKGARQEAKALRTQLDAMQQELQEVQSELLQRDTIQGNGNDTGGTRLGRLLPGRARQLIGRARDRRTLRAQCVRAEQSGWFDRNWYLQAYEDVRTAGVDPIEHYFTVGWREKRNPCEAFDTAFYLRSNPDVRRSGVNPLWHYIEFGDQEGRPPRDN